MSGNSKRGVSQPPKGSEHRPEAVAARKRRRFNTFMAQFGPRQVGSAAQRRRRK